MFLFSIVILIFQNNYYLDYRLRYFRTNFDEEIIVQVDHRKNSKRFLTNISHIIQLLIIIINQAI